MIHADGIAYVELTQPEFHERSQDAVGWDNLQFISEDRLFFQDVQIDPRTTYLRTISDPPVNFRPPNDFVYVDSDRVARHVDSEALELRTLIPGKTIEPGDYLLLESVGEYCFTNPICENTIGGLWGVFSGSGVLLQDEDASIQNRVPDQLSVQAGTFSLVETPVNGGLPSDIESDFWIRSPGDSSRTVVQVPEGATHLFVSAADEVWFENWLPLGSEFGLRVTLYPDSSADGDVDGNGTVDVADIDTMSRQVRSGEFSVAFDLTHDGRVDVNDRIVLIKDRINTWVGDSNLDGEFNTGDLIAVFQAGLFETGNPAGWLQGDWDGNGVFDTGDIIYAFQDGGYEQGPQSAAVPEPVGFVTLMWSAVVVAVVRRKKACGFTAGKVGEE
ncbi:MAG: hypothetical protein KDA87_11385 [Planctomycetales bacterium]|nr:hypothetical protein [Planctomycetales bacterium]